MEVYKIVTDGKARTTGRIMREVVERYYLDMAPYAHLSLPAIFNLIKNLPYRPDPINIETLQRPLYTLRGTGTGGDCDCKAVALAAWARLQGIPYHFVAIRRPGRKSLHHVAVELYTDNGWLFLDPTYRFNTLGRKRAEAERVIV